MSIATIGNNIVEKSSSDGVPLENKTIIHTPPLHSKLGCLFLSTVTRTEAKLAMRGWGKERYIFPFFSWKHVRAKPNIG